MRSRRSSALCITTDRGKSNSRLRGLDTAVGRSRNGHRAINGDGCSKAVLRSTRMNVGRSNVVGFFGGVRSRSSCGLADRKDINGGSLNSAGAVALTLLDGDGLTLDDGGGGNLHDSRGGEDSVVTALIVAGSCAKERLVLEDVHP